jgi:hypothetical protein
MIIGICGLIGSGKGTVADTLVEKHNFKKISFADKLKDGVASVFGWDRDMLEGKTAESREWRETQDDFWTKETGRTITPRLVLQEFGTECMRNGFSDNIWVSLVKQEILNNPTVNFVIPDVRFKNEVEMVKKLNGQVWVVKRGADPVWFRMYQDIGVEPQDVHRSEWEWAQTDFNQVIYNDSDLDALNGQVQDRLASTLHLLSA